MEQALWTEVDQYLDDTIVGGDADLAAALEDVQRAGMPTISVSPALGKLLHVLGRTIGARRILEVGTLGGYSTIWLARALPPEGRLVTLEIDAGNAAVAAASIARAGVADSGDPGRPRRRDPRGARGRRHRTIRHGLRGR